MIDKYLLSISEASKKYGIGRDKLYNLLEKEIDIPKIKIGNVTKINAALMDVWINKITNDKRNL